MNVYWVWSIHCPQCKTFAQSGVVDLVAQTIHGVRDVWWVPRRVDLITSTDPRDNTPAPTLKMEDGQVQPVAVFSQNIKDLERKIDEDLKTPTIILEHEDTAEGLNPIDVVDQSVFDNIEDEAWSGARSLMTKILNFYIRHTVAVSRRDKQQLRQEQRAGAARRLKPTYEYGKFNLHEWTNAFARAREAQY